MRNNQNIRRRRTPFLDYIIVAVYDSEQEQTFKFFSVVVVVTFGELFEMTGGLKGSRPRHLQIRRCQPLRCFHLVLLWICIKKSTIKSTGEEKSWKIPKAGPALHCNVRNQQDNFEDSSSETCRKGPSLILRWSLSIALLLTLRSKGAHGEKKRWRLLEIKSRKV